VVGIAVRVTLVLVLGVLMTRGLVDARPDQPRRLETLSPGRLKRLELRSESFSRRQAGRGACPDGEVVAAAAALLDQARAACVRDAWGATAWTGIARPDEIRRRFEDVELHRRTSLLGILPGSICFEGRSAKR
jgi:hypothetical protein